jgi:hypothetical protein
LIKHLNDERLTRTVKRGFNNFPTYHQRVGMVVSDLLQQLSGTELGKNWLERQTGWNVERAAAQAWWVKAKKVGEEPYLVRHVLPTDAKDLWPNATMLRIIAARYPWRLKQIYRTILHRRPGLQSWPLTDAIARSSLPPELKEKLFREGVAHSNLEHRRMALSELMKTDAKHSVSVLIRTLQQLPRTPKEPYWLCPEAAFAHQVMDTDDPHAWDVLRRVARRSDVGLRMELLNPMDYTYIGERQRRQRLEFLAAFMDDATLRDKRSKPSMWSGPHAGFTFPRMEVRDLAAMKAGSILGVDGEPGAEWKSAQWSAYRDRVRKALTDALNKPDQR